MWRQSVPCGDLRPANVGLVRQLIQNQYVDNVSTTWNCQSWVMDALGSLQAGGLLELRGEAERQLRSMLQNWQ